MNAWTWEAGSRCGITGSRRRARRHAAEALRCGAAEEAWLEQVIVEAGAGSLDDRYVPLSGTRLEGRRRGAGVQWGAAA